MKSKILTSSFLGLLFPWTYFLFVTVSPLRVYDQSGTEITATESSGSGGVLSFIEFNGIGGSLFIYMKVAVICALFVLVACFTYDFIAKKYASKP